MKTPEEPIEWPPHYPPSDGVKKFFIGVRWLGPDLGFFKELREQQARRTVAHMVVWPTEEERDIALLMGKHFSRWLRWRSPYFLPDDKLCTIAGGPCFDTDAMDFLAALDEIEKELGTTLGDQFWKDSVSLSLHDVVSAFLTKNKTLPNKTPEATR
jgi:hypothetical protein